MSEDKKITLLFVVLLVSTKVQFLYYSLFYQYCVVLINPGSATNVRLCANLLESFVPCVQDIPNSNQGLYTNCPDWRLLCVSSVLPGSYWIVL
jgi:hypothetical protein